VGLDPKRLDLITRHFDGYVADGRLPGYLASVSRAGAVAWVGMGGYRDREAEVPMSADTLFRIYSMTKPITTIAAMRLFEEGRFKLTDEVASIIGCFEAPKVFAGGTPDRPFCVPATEPIRVWHLMTHTAGLTYGFAWDHPTDAIYRSAGFEWGLPRGDLAAICDMLSELPLRFEPGTAWCYSMATDVLGRVIECITGEPLDAALRRLVLDPLKMDETGFFAPEPAHHRLAQLYIPDGRRDNLAVAVPEMGAGAKHKPEFLGGGGGLVSTAGDYRRFTAMLINGGELEGERIVGPRTIEFMTRNFLPGGADLESVAQGLFADPDSAGIGFGLGFSVVLDAADAKVPTTEGSFSWGGAASTVFWVDPLEALEVSFFTQLLPSSTHPISEELSQIVYASIVD
jgi:CubicO group peptidase (beta-lactamase class C family)